MAPDVAAEIVRACAAGELPANVGLLRLVMACYTQAEVERALALGPADLAALWRAHPEYWELAKALLATVDHQALPASSEAEAARAIVAAFDRAAALEPDAASALYALGDAHLLDVATTEIVDFLDERNCLPENARVLDIGCGAGRLEAALASRVTHVLGLEASGGMAEAARRRCGGWPHVVIASAENGEPPDLPLAGFDLAIAVDAFPYIVQAGGALPARWFQAVGRALAPGGQFVILNYSYRGELARDRWEAEALAASAGLAPQDCDARPFRNWDAAAFRFAKA